MITNKDDYDVAQQAVYIHLRGHEQDLGGCYGCPVETSIAEAFADRTHVQDPIGKTLVKLFNRLVAQGVISIPKDYDEES